MMSPLKTSAPDPSLISTLWGTPGSSFLKWIVTGPAGAVRAAVERDVLGGELERRSGGRARRGGGRRRVGGSDLGGEPRVVVGLRDRVDLEQHRPVERAAQLGALAAIRARLVDGEVERV